MHQGVYGANVQLGLFQVDIASMFRVILTYLSMPEVSENEIMCQRVLVIGKKEPQLYTAPKKPSAVHIPSRKLCSVPEVGTSEHRTPTGTFVSNEGGNMILYYIIQQDHAMLTLPIWCAHMQRSLA